MKMTSFRKIIIRNLLLALTGISIVLAACGCGGSEKTIVIRVEHQDSDFTNKDIQVKTSQKSIWKVLHEAGIDGYISADGGVIIDIVDGEESSSWVCEVNGKIITDDCEVNEGDKIRLFINKN